MATSVRLKTVSLWIASAVLAAIFLATGVPKLGGAQGWVQHFAQWGYADWFRLVVGAVEVISGTLLLIPRLATIGASGIAVIMAGATYTHIFRASDEAGRAIFTMILLVVAATIGYARRPRTRSEATKLN